MVLVEVGGVFHLFAEAEEQTQRKGRDTENSSVTFYSNPTESNTLHFHWFSSANRGKTGPEAGPDRTQRRLQQSNRTRGLEGAV